MMYPVNPINTPMMKVINISNMYAPRLEWTLTTPAEIVRTHYCEPTHRVRLDLIDHELLIVAKEETLYSLPEHQTSSCRVIGTSEASSGIAVRAMNVTYPSSSIVTSALGISQVNVMVSKLRSSRILQYHFGKLSRFLRRIL